MSKFEKQVQKAIKKAEDAYIKAENALNEITILIQSRYPNIEATISGNEIFFIDKDNKDDAEYYSLDDLENEFGVIEATPPPKIFYTIEFKNNFLNPNDTENRYEIYKRVIK